MEYRDYLEEVRKDGKAYIRECIGDYDDDGFEELFEGMVDDDNVTGNMSGSYTFSSKVARENVSDLLWDLNFLDRLSEFEQNLGDLMNKGSEAVDVTARWFCVYDLRDEFEEYFDALRECVRITDAAAIMCSFCDAKDCESGICKVQILEQDAYNMLRDED